MRSAPDQHREPRNGNGHDNPSERRHGPRTDKRRNDAERHSTWRRIAQEDVEPGELLRGLAGEGRAILRESAAGDEERNRPREHADRECHRAAEQRTGRSTSRAIEQHHRQERKRQPDRLRAHADGKSRNQRAGDNQSARLSDRRRICAVCTSPTHERRREARLRRECHAETRHVAERAQRGKPEQRRRDDHKRRKRRAAIALCISGRTIQFLEASEQRHQRKHRQRAEQGAPERQRTGSRTATPRATVCRAR